jgi:hypothetical protein
MCDRLLTDTHDVEEIVKGLALAWADEVVDDVCGCNGHGSGECRCPAVEDQLLELLERIGVSKEARTAVGRAELWRLDLPFNAILEKSIDYLLNGSWRPFL